MNDSTLYNGQPDRPAMATDEGGLRAPPDLHGWRKFWWWFHFLILVNLARLRFVAVLLVIGFIIIKWDLLMAHYDRWTRPASAAEVASGDHEYFCPMHPAVVRDNPKEKCPICFMPLSKRKKGDVKEEVLPAGVVNRVQLSPYRVALAGIGTWTLDYMPLTKEITAVGYIEFNERGERKVPAWVAGRLDKLFVSETGQMVRQGDPLALLYSPELIVSVQNLLDARTRNNPSLEQSARRRLELLGIEDRQIDEIIQRGRAETHLTIRSPISGHVVNKYVREGEYVQEGSPLYDVVDLSTVWIEAQIYEDDLAFLPLDLGNPGRQQTGDSIDVTATTRALPNDVFQGELTFVYPHVDERTRTVTVRFELDNPDHKLRPGSTATVTLRVPASKVAGLARAQGDTSKMAAAAKVWPVEMAPGEEIAEGNPFQSDGFLAVPQSAVIDTGNQKIVYRETVPGVYEGVQVTLGPKMTGPDGVTFYPVLRGLEQGEKVVTAGSFLVDAETRLNPAAGSIYFGGSSGSNGGTSSVTVVRPSTPEDEEAKITAALARLSEPDRKLALAQEYCPILSDNRLGSMGEPVKVMVDGEPVFLCCEGCQKQALRKPVATLAKVNELKREKTSADATPARAKSGEVPPPSLVPETTSQESAAIQPLSEDEREIAEALRALSKQDLRLAERQRYCAVLTDSRLGSMGTPIKLSIDGQPVFICCKGCQKKALADKQKTLAAVERLIRENNQDAGR